MRFSVFKIWDSLAQLLSVARTHSQVAKTTSVGVDCLTESLSESLSDSLSESLSDSLAL